MSNLDPAVILLSLIVTMMWHAGGHVTTVHECSLFYFLEGWHLCGNSRKFEYPDSKIEFPLCRFGKKRILNIISHKICVSCYVYHGKGSCVCVFISEFDRLKNIFTEYTILITYILLPHNFKHM